MLVALSLQPPVFATGDTGVSSTMATGGPTSTGDTGLMTTETADTDEGGCEADWARGGEYVGGVCSQGGVNSVELKQFLGELGRDDYAINLCDDGVATVSYYTTTETSESYAFVDNWLVASRYHCSFCTDYCCGDLCVSGNIPTGRGTWPEESGCVLVRPESAPEPELLDQANNPMPERPCGGCDLENEPAHLAWMFLFSFAGLRRRLQRTLSRPAHPDQG